MFSVYFISVGGRAANAELYFKGLFVSKFVLKTYYSSIDILNLNFIDNFEVYVVIIYENY
jgi:hypothetical protein